MEKALGKNKVKYAPRWLHAPCPTGKGSKWRPVGFQHRQSMQGGGMAKGGMEAGTRSRLPLGPIPSLHPSRRHHARPCIPYSCEH